MKKCTYCGKEYPDETTVCTVDGQPVAAVVVREASAPKQSVPAQSGRPVKPALMTRLRSLHLYLGCIFAPMLLFFAISGIWQTLGLTNGRLLQTLSTIHEAKKFKSGALSLNNGFIMIFDLIMAVAFIITTILGVMMALNLGRSRRVAIYCLVFGVAFPTLLVVIGLL
jgi:hypothetical protein